MSVRCGWVWPLVLLTGCAAVGPDYERPAIDVPEAFASSGGDEVALDREVLARWWQAFADPQLDALIGRVLDSNLDLAAAVERVEFARASFGVTKADRWPTIDARGAVTRGREFSFPTTDNYSIGASLGWEVDLFGRVRRAVEGAEASFEATVEDLRGVQVALAAETAATYLQLLSLRERLGIARSNVEVQEKSLEIAQSRFDRGIASALDPARARANLQTTRSVVPLLELSLRRVEHRLAVLGGADPGSWAGAVDAADSLPSFPATLMVGIPAELILERPDLRALERRLAAQSAQVGEAIAALYPSINLSASWDWLAPEAGNLFDSGTGFGSVGPLVSLPLFNGRRLRSRIDAQEANLREADLRLRQGVLLAQEEVENALTAILRDRQRVELLSAGVEAARESVELSRQVYTSGQSDFQNVLDAERSLFSLEDELAIARVEALLDLVELYRALGGGWGVETAGA